MGMEEEEDDDVSNKIRSHCLRLFKMSRASIGIWLLVHIVFILSLVGEG